MSLSVPVPPSPTSTTTLLNYRHSNFLPKTNYPLGSFYKHVTLSDHNTLQSVTNDILCTRAVGRCEFIDLHRELVPYDKAWDLQKAIVKQKKSLIERNEECCDTLIVLQHHPVYTLGTGSSEEYLNFNINNAPLHVFRTERGGEVTYHGPGQLVMYPIINLRNHKMDLHWYLRALEEVVIRLLATTFSIKASRLEGFRGVWVGDQIKLAAVGIRVSQWIAYHGLALNVSMDLSPFQQIVPCGLQDRGVGSIKGVLQELKCHAAEDLVRVIDHDYTLLEIAHDSLVREFCQVFQLRLEPVSLSMPL